MHSSDEHEVLTKKIEELESLIKANKTQATDNIPVLDVATDDMPEFNAEIPILDELVDNNHSYTNENDQQSKSSYTTEQLTELVDNIESKLTGELETLVDTIRGTMKHSIIEELKSRLEISNTSNAVPLPEEQSPANQENVVQNQSE